MIYEASFITKVDNGMDPVADLWHFKSGKTGRKYMVLVERLPHQMFAVKFHTRSDKNHPCRFTRMTGDGEPLSIVNTVINIMCQYAQRYPQSSFSFIASRGDGETDEMSKRFRLYHRIILNKFSDREFCISYDTRLSLYLLLRRSEVEAGRLSVNDVLTYVNDEYMI